jgi:hypothetical protein
MTAIHGYIQPSRRPGELGIHSVDHFNFAVPDLAVAQNFYGEFGLDVGERGNRLTLGTFAQPHIWGNDRRRTAQETRLYLVRRF